MLKRTGAPVAVLCLSLFVASSISALSFTNLYVFGDSIVDAGNSQALALGFGQADPAPAGSGYFQGRFSNGPTFADQINVAVEGSNSVRSGAPANGDNFAYGGARARTQFDLIPDLTAQMNAFTGVHPTPDANALYLINVGGNDVRDITIGNLAGAARQAVIDAARLAVTTSVTTLTTAGVAAANIMFVGIGDVGKIPEILALGGATSAAGTAASTDLNNAIRTNLPANVGFFDTMALLAQVRADPAAYGLPAGINQTNSCLGSGTPNPNGPPTCTNYMFFDTIHPTSVISQVIGTHLLVTIPVPEPGTVSLLAIGLIAIGIRRRARH